MSKEYSLKSYGVDQCAKTIMRRTCTTDLAKGIRSVLLPFLTGPSPKRFLVTMFV